VSKAYETGAVERPLFGPILTSAPGA